MNYEAIALWSQVVAAVVFAIFVVWSFNKFITPAIAAATAAKNEEIAANERRRDDAVKAVELARSEVVEADSDARHIGERIQADAQREAVKIVADAKAEGERIVRNAGAELERARLAARDHLRVEMIEKALNLARERAQAQIDDDANEALVGKFIDELERGEKR